MENIALGKPTTASSYVKPYIPGKAVNGNISPTSRWVCNKIPGYLVVDFGKSCWIDRWVVKNMGTAGWSTTYNMSNYSLGGSNDNFNWITIDAITGNTLSTTDRTFSAASYRYVRLLVTSGLSINKALAACMELEVYAATPTSSYLGALTISEGTLEPGFNSTIMDYTADVSYNTTSITITPTSIDGGTIMLNGIAVISGTPSPAIRLEVGSNPITVQVTSRIGGAISTYTIHVTRQANPNLTNLVVKNIKEALVLTPSFSEQTYAYALNTEFDLPETPGGYQVTITPSADPTAIISVNGTIVKSQEASLPITLAVGINNIPVIVTSVSGIVKTYNLVITRTSSSYLTGFVIKSGKSTVNTSPSFNKYTTLYTASVAGTTISAVTVTPSVEDSNSVIRVNGMVVTNNTPSASISLSTGNNTITIAVTPGTGLLEKIYTIVLTK